MAKTSDTRLAVLEEQNSQVTDNIKTIREDISEIKRKLDGTFVKKEDYISESSDKEARLRRLETWGAISIGLMYALQFYFQFLKK